MCNAKWGTISLVVLLCIATPCLAGGTGNNEVKASSLSAGIPGGTNQTLSNGTVQIVVEEDYWISDEAYQRLVDAANGGNPEVINGSVEVFDQDSNNSDDTVHAGNGVSIRLNSFSTTSTNGGHSATMQVSINLSATTNSTDPDYGTSPITNDCDGTPNVSEIYFKKKWDINDPATVLDINHDGDSSNDVADQPPISENPSQTVNVNH